MKLICILLALGFLQVFSDKNPIHKDAWLVKWSHWIDKKLPPTFAKIAGPLLFIVPPVAVTAALCVTLPSLAYLFFSLLILLFSLGRGAFAPHLEAYTSASADDDWNAALESAQRADIDTEEVAQGDWPKLNQLVLEHTAYQGFERLFAVLFWFAFFGAAGALFYRLVFLRGKLDDGAFVNKALWAVEWPAVRLLSASFAVTGNFVGCVNRLKVYAMSTSNNSTVVLTETVLGALSIDDALVQSCFCTHRELQAVKQLYTRTLWFWLALVAIISILD